MSCKVLCLSWSFTKESSLFIRLLLVQVVLLQLLNFGIHEEKAKLTAVSFLRSQGPLLVCLLLSTFSLFMYEIYRYRWYIYGPEFYFCLEEIIGKVHLLHLARKVI